MIKTGSYRTFSGTNHAAVVFKPGTTWVPLHADIEGTVQKIIKAAIAAKAILTENHNNSVRMSYIACFPTLEHDGGFFTKDNLEHWVRCALFKAYRGEKVVFHIGNQYRVRAHATGELTSFNTECAYMEQAVFTRSDGRPWFIVPKKEVTTISSHKIRAISIPKRFN